MRQKNFDCCSISSKTHGLKQQKIEKIGINLLGSEIVFVVGEGVAKSSN